MKYAIVNDQKVEATKGAKGVCPSCGSEIIAKCGELKVNHWSHKGNRNCDQWWENETEWHRSWKDNFPIEWQEVVHFDDSGEKHIADVKTQNEWVLEFQHSFLNSKERLSRNTFYTKLIWVVDGLRRKKDKSQFQRVLKEESTAVNGEPYITQVRFPDECRLLKEWSNSSSLVFFDFQEKNWSNQSILWLLFPNNSLRNMFLSPVPRNELIESLNKNNFEELINNRVTSLRNGIADNQRIMRENNALRQPNRSTGNNRFMTNRQRRRLRRL
jgi:competence protein CoiA